MEEFDPEEQLHHLVRRYALSAAREGYARSGRGAAVVPWPPEDRLSVSFLPEVACGALGDEVMLRVGTYDPFAEFVMVYLFAGGGVEAYTYRIPSGPAAHPAPPPPAVH
jgi:hypothetical protein